MNINLPEPWINALVVGLWGLYLFYLIINYRVAGYS